MAGAASTKVSSLILNWNQLKGFQRPVGRKIWFTRRRKRDQRCKISFFLRSCNLKYLLAVGLRRKGHTDSLPESEGRTLWGS